MSAAPSALAYPGRNQIGIIAWFFKALSGLLQVPEYVFLAALTAMLFSPPDLQRFPADRVVFLLLLAVATVRLLLRCDRVKMHSASWPIFGLLLLGIWGALGQPYDAKAWSVLAAQWIVPVTMFHLGASIFRTADSQRKLEWFSIAVLLYLALTSGLWLLHLEALILPQWILNESVGIHFDRARGPFLQAVANGVCLNVLAIVALHAWDRQPATYPHGSRFPKRGALAALLLVVTPLALLATKTRAVWLAASFSAALLILFARGRRSRRAALGLVLVAAVAGSLAWVLQSRPGELTERLQERSPVEFRLDMYRAGWQMFTEKPLLGWGSDANIQPEIERRLSSFHPEYYIFHNTFLQLAVQYGVVGVLLYAWLLVVLFRLGSGANFRQTALACPFGAGFGLMWRIMLCVYLLNASVVVMSYQFLNGYMFTIAGILAAQQKSCGAETGGQL